MSVGRQIWVRTLIIWVLARVWMLINFIQCVHSTFIARGTWRRPADLRANAPSWRGSKTSTERHIFLSPCRFCSRCQKKRAETQRRWMGCYRTVRVHESLSYHQSPGPNLHVQRSDTSSFQRSFCRIMAWESPRYFLSTNL